ncbi:sulfotransferase ssu-1-like [Rhipicephalus sanguineus]|uniref:sulfotransferase ssu-1-like n=1 Tax=Rhipicephalus sanguineus TaxID=34632 RepID=UPI001895BD0C|nr:sulfotransferase ssu-1-like [Rhipicephalus sanguineus]
MSARRFPAYQVIDGLKYSKTYLPENVRAIRSYMPEDDDLVLVSYLKCGNNWLEQIIELILHRGESAENYAEFHRWCPYPELTGMRYLNEMQPPRFFKTHFQYQQQLMNPKAKFVYLTRNPLDVCVSFYHYVRNGSVYGFEDGTFDDFVHAFVAAEVERGDYCDHLLSWYAHRHEENVFFLTFEQLKNDFRNTVLSLAGFMGEKYRRMLVEDEDVYRNVVEKSSVPYMSKVCYVDQSIIEKLTEKDQPFIDAAHRFTLSSPGMLKGTTVVRKGAVGDWKSHFTQRHLDLVREWIAKRNAAPVIRDLWADMDLGGIV